MTRTAYSHISEFKRNIKLKKPEPMIDKQIFWNHFSNYMPDDYIIDERNEKIIYTILRYFSGCSDFNEFGIIKNKASLEKGLLIYGNNGVGKSKLLELISQTGLDLYSNYKYKKSRFKTISCGSFVQNYMKSVKSKSDEFNLNSYYKYPLHVEDLGFEKKAFLSYELMGDALFERCRNNARTFVTTNLKPSDIQERYGHTIFDRLPEMFNIIKWEGESFRGGI